MTYSSLNIFEIILFHKTLTHLLLKKRSEIRKNKDMILKNANNEQGKSFILVNISPTYFSSAKLAVVSVHYRLVIKQSLLEFYRFVTNINEALVFEHPVKQFN